MNKLDIKLTPIEELVKKGFMKFGDKFECVDFNQETGLYLWKRTSKEGSVSYEVIKPQKNNGVVIYPSSSQWGINGKTFMCETTARLCLDNGFSWYSNYKAQMRNK